MTLLRSIHRIVLLLACIGMTSTGSLYAQTDQWNWPSPFETGKSAIASESSLSPPASAPSAAWHLTAWQQNTGSSAPLPPPRNVFSSPELLIPPQPLSGAPSRPGAAIDAVPNMGNSALATPVPSNPYLATPALTDGTANGVPWSPQDGSNSNVVIGQSPLTPMQMQLPDNAGAIAPFTMQSSMGSNQYDGCQPGVVYPGPEGWYNNHVRQVPFEPGAFLPTPIPPAPANPYEEELTYRGKYAVPVQRPWVEFWRPFYVPGTPPPARAPFGPTNLLNPHFLVYGDFRTGVGINTNAAGRTHNWANRLNLDMDLQITSTERIHGFMGPLDDGTQFTRLDFTDSADYLFAGDANFDTLFFEGDLGAITGGYRKTAAPFDLPFTFGLVPLLYQNGIWMQDAVLGAAFALPSKHSSALRWSNFDATFFAAVDQINSDAFAGSPSAAEMAGTAWFIEAYEGYIEVDYAYIHDDVGLNRSYNNLSAAYTRRYFARVSNSVRIITNFGQDLPDAQQTADGYLLLLENSLISFLPNRFIPYCNFFYGSGRPQPAARVGGPLANTGINFDTDALTGYPSLDATGHNTYGAALGMNLLGVNYYDQLMIEMAALGSYGSAPFRRVVGDQYAAGARYQRPLSNAWLIRLDAMYGFLRETEDIHGVRAELRWKF